MVVPTPILTNKLASSFDALILEHTGTKAQEDDFGAKVATLQLRDADARHQGQRPSDHGKGVTDDLMQRVANLVFELPDANRYLLHDLGEYGRVGLS